MIKKSMERIIYLVDISEADNFIKKMQKKRYELIDINYYQSDKKELIFEKRF